MSRASSFQVKPVVVRNGEFTYETFRLTGWLNGKRIRQQFKSRDEALGEKNRFEVQAANVHRDIQAVNTRLSVEQVGEAEAAFRRLDGRSLTEAVDWYLRTYRPPVSPTLVEDAVVAFIADRSLHCRPRQLTEYRQVLGAIDSRSSGFAKRFSKRHIHTITTQEIEAYMAELGVGPKRWNNLRGDFAALFNFARKAPRNWCTENPVDPIRKFKIARGVPDVLTAARAAELMAFLETFKGGPRSKLQPGCLVPYFALALFAGLRPAQRDSELVRIAKEPTKFIKMDLGVIRLTPEASKVNAVRQIKIRDNLRAWLARYPVDKFPIIPSNAKRLICAVRKRFGLTHDVLRHTFCSMHVARWKSLGEAALEAGNSEAIVRKHYINLATESEAEAFWAIVPTQRQASVPPAG